MTRFYPKNKSARMAMAYCVGITVMAIVVMGSVYLWQYNRIGRRLTFLTSSWPVTAKESVVKFYLPQGKYSIRYSGEPFGEVLEPNGNIHTKILVDGLSILEDKTSRLAFNVAKQSDVYVLIELGSDDRAIFMNFEMEEISPSYNERWLDWFMPTWVSDAPSHLAGSQGTTRVLTRF